MPIISEMTPGQASDVFEVLDLYTRALQEARLKLQQRHDLEMLHPSEGAIQMHLLNLRVMEEETATKRRQFHDGTLAVQHPTAQTLTEMRGAVVRIQDFNFLEVTAGQILSAVADLPGDPTIGPPRPRPK